MEHQTLRSLQEAALIKMLNFNKSSEDLEMEGYDEFCRDSILPVLNTKVLKENGVTLHMQLHSKRERISDVDVIYFIQPTEENIIRVCDDCKDHLYDSIYLNFSTPLPRVLLELLARKTIETKSTSLITSIYDQFCGFISLEEDLFSLNMKNSFYMINNPKNGEAEINKMVRSICDSLFPVLVTMGTVPILVSPPADSCSKRVVTLLDQMLRDNLASRSEIFNHGEVSYYSRPLMVIIDRTDNPTIPLYHTTSYLELMSDLLPFHHNRVKITIEENGVKKNKSYYLDSSNDEFWRNNSLLPFPEVVENNKKQIDIVKEKEKEVRNKAKTSQNSSSESTRGLLSAVDTVQEILDEKISLEMHTQILKAVMKEVLERDPPTFGSAEEEILSGNGNKSRILGILKDITKQKECYEDKLRLAAVYISNENTSMSDVDEVMRCMEEVSNNLTVEQRGSDLSIDCLRFLKEMKSISMPQDNSNNIGNNNNNNNHSVSSILNTASGLLSMATAQVKHYLPSSKNYTTTQLVDDIMNRRGSGSSCDGYLFYDPKVNDIRGVSDYLKGTTFDNVIVFVIGGGCYSEYENLKNYGKSSRSKKNIIYGCSELVNSREFLKELGDLVSVTH